MKSGTTTLANMIRSHPHIFMPKKELNFFSDNFSRGTSWYDRQFNPYRFSGEKSANYMYLKECPERISKYNPDMRLIFILRNPVDRTYSNYLHALRKGREVLSFKEAVDAEEDRIKIDRYYGYKTRSVYFRQIENYLQYFPKTQMHFIIFEEMVKNPDRALLGVYKFLGVRKHTSIIRHSNRSRLPLSLHAQRFFYKFLSETPLYNPLYRINLRLGWKKCPNMDQEMISSLEKYFRPYNEKLSVLISRNLPW